MTCLGRPMIPLSATRALATGGAVLVFPEGASEPAPELRPLRTGTARLLLAAEAGGATGVSLVPGDPRRDVRAGPLRAFRRAHRMTAAP